MLFNSLQFAIFFALVLLLHRSLPERSRNGLLLGASILTVCELVDFLTLSFLNKWHARKQVDDSERG